MRFSRIHSELTYNFSEMSFVFVAVCDDQCRRPSFNDELSEMTHDDVKEPAAMFLLQERCCVCGFVLEMMTYRDVIRC